MEINLITYIVQKTGLPKDSVQSTVQLLEEGSTIPFIARYRKEWSGNLDEVEIENIQNEKSRYEELEKRKSAILKAIAEQEQLTDQLREKIVNCTDLTELEDIYLPYKQKRTTKGSVAKDKGLEPLAKMMMAQNLNSLEETSERFLNDKVQTIEEALSGARDIIAEWLNENEYIRRNIRWMFEKGAIISSKLIKGKEVEGEKFKDYFKWEEPLKRIPSHRFLAISRGESEGFLRVKISIEEEKALTKIEQAFIKTNNRELKEQLQIAAKDSYKRLISSSIETEFKKAYKEKSDLEAIDVFAKNLKQLLLAPPLGQKNVLAIDPGFRTGCKVVCLNDLGDIVYNETIYPHPPQNESAMAAKKINTIVSRYKIEAIAIGNGTAGRETERFIQKMRFNEAVEVYVVNENGASIYSASKIAREEFPQYDVTVRGAISIGRRLMDPLAELVKIDAKSIGVGQYQHDVDQKLLKQSLDRVVESAVNRVGVNVNSASQHLLQYISGLGPQLAQRIVDYRTDNGSFTNRKELLKVKGMGAKSYEQSAGFLRIIDGDNPLDNSAVHPERYDLVKRMAKSVGVSVDELVRNEKAIDQIDFQKFITTEIGMPTLNDLKEELKKPARDPRKGIKLFEFDKNVSKISDLEVGMVLPGIVTNITNFGAFVDVGVKQDGLVHISHLANHFVANPNEVVNLQQTVKVKVLEVDESRKRIQLSMKEV
ncbi:Tex family protein [Acidiluteibacter ferrifornacis]|uniref:S1 RNA-binding domain-containing protein n=1 Tax=Acidiluteibacter ferrifornacis TaxID=2692424 RepID=A0A6N9NL10_9FLAO|nr:Tex family protein [Acidiluteibacter ferrifornacis]NBG65920.1 S1 RNA-binding domain-containing protein [Acidiluteibacter ferrifornacis]